MGVVMLKTCDNRHITHDPLYTRLTPEGCRLLCPDCIQADNVAMRRRLAARLAEVDRARKEAMAR